MKSLLLSCHHHVFPTAAPPKHLTIFLLFILWFTPFSATCGALTTVGMLAGAGGLGDQSYNDMTMAGLGKARQLYDFTLVVEETGTSRQSQTEGLDRLLEQGSEVIVANGAGLGNLVIEYSRKHPEVLFLVNDFVIENRENVASTVFAHEEGSFLIGMLAALLFPEGQLGFIGGVDMAVIHEFLDGFAKGAQYGSEQSQIYSAFVSPAGDYSGFTSPRRGLEIATAMYQRGTDIIFSVAGLTGNGVIQAALEQNKLAIGVDADQDHMAEGYVLTSMMKRLDRSTFDEIVKIAKGEFSPGVTHYSLANEGISLSPMRFTRHLVSDAILGRIDQAKEDIISGKISLGGLPAATSSRIGN